MRSLPWHIVTGEYAPAPGGVAAYSHLVARGLAAAGDEVHVWAPPFHGPPTEDPGIRVHALADGYAPRGLARLAWEFRKQAAPRRLLLQYVPNAFGLRGMNYPLASWIGALGRENDVWIMFHEVALSWAGWRRWKQSTLSVATRRMARRLVMRADRVFVSTPGWEDQLRGIAPRWTAGATWMPVASNVATEVSPSALATARARFDIPADAEVIGHFGTYGSLVYPLVKSVLRSLLMQSPARHAVLIGRGSEAAARDLARSLGDGRRIHGTGFVTAEAVAAHMLACDLLIQPFADGVSGRRTSLIGALALGVPVATNRGVATESVWQESGAVALAPSPEELAGVAASILNDRGRANALRSRARQLYAERFSIEHTIGSLRAPPPSAA